MRDLTARKQPYVGLAMCSPEKSSQVLNYVSFFSNPFKDFVHHLFDWKDAVTFLCLEQDKYFVRSITLVKYMSYGSSGAVLSINNTEFKRFVNNCHLQMSEFLYSNFFLFQ